MTTTPITLPAESPRLVKAAEDQPRAAFHAGVDQKRFIILYENGDPGAERADLKDAIADVYRIAELHRITRPPGW